MLSHWSYASKGANKFADHRIAYYGGIVVLGAYLTRYFCRVSAVYFSYGHSRYNRVYSNMLCSLITLEVYK